MVNTKVPAAFAVECYRPTVKRINGDVGMLICLIVSTSHDPRAESRVWHVLLGRTYPYYIPHLGDGCCNFWICETGDRRYGYVKSFRIAGFRQKCLGFFWAELPLPILGRKFIQIEPPCR